MKNLKLKKILGFGIIFIIASLFMIEAGVYRKSFSKESAAFKLNLQSEEAKPLIVDIHDQGIPKRLVQPGKISISTGHGPGIFNKGKEPVWVKVHADGFDENVKIESTESFFQEGEGIFTKEVLPGKALNLQVTLDIPRGRINKKHEVSSGALVFTDYKSGKELGKLPIQVVNSSLGKKISLEN